MILQRFFMPSDQQVVFISYAWGGESESVANEIDQAVLSAGITLIRDKRDLGFKGLIKEFMEKIGQGNAVILVISDKYLKSPNCMFELLEVQKSGDFYERIFPLVLPDANIYKSTGIISYLKYWEDQIDDLDAAIKGLDSFADTQGIRDDIDLFTDIRGAIAKLATTFRNMNTLTIAEMRSKSFSPLMELLGKKIAKEENSSPTPKSKYGKVLYHIPEMMQLQEWTRCIVRLAWDELLLNENLHILEEEKVIENVRLGQVMQVCIEEGRDGDSFEIDSLSSKEQLILEDDYTEWLFDVKAIKEGTFTLVLRITLLQVIEGFGERKKDIVLERNVTTKALAPEALPVFEATPVSISNSPKADPSIERQGNAQPVGMAPTEMSHMERPMPQPSVYPASAPKPKSKLRKLMPYAASITLLIAAAVFVLPEFSGDQSPKYTSGNQTAPDEPGASIDFPTKEETNSSPPTSRPVPIPGPISEPPSGIGTPAPGMDIDNPPVLGNIEVSLDNTVLVALNPPNSIPEDLRQSKYLFYTILNKLDSIKPGSLSMDVYSKEDIESLSLPSTIRFQTAKQINDSINKRSIIQTVQPAINNAAVNANN